MTPPIAYHRVQHAGHYGRSHPDVGHDLEIWIVTTPKLADAARAIRSLSEAAGAEWELGDLRGGVQTWTFSRRAPLTGPPCKWCPKPLAK